MKKICILLFALTTAFISCKKNVSSPSNTITGGEQSQTTPVTGSVAGIVTDENNNPVANAEVKIGANAYLTNSLGFYITPVISLDKFITTIKVAVPGYFTLYRSFAANATMNQVNFKITPKTLIGTFEASNGGEVPLANGSSVSFQANGINIKNTGASYSGTVKMYAAYFDPSAEDYFMTKTGGSFAEDAEKMYAIKPVSTIAVELESASGESLQLANGKPASIKLSIPNSLQSKVPSVIQTGSLDERGVWINEGTAQKNGNVYEMEVSHFSFWSTYGIANPVFLNIHVSDQNNDGVPGALVILTSSTTFGTAGNFADALGNISGIVPGDETLQFDSYLSSLGCYGSHHTEAIGPYSSSASINVVMPITPTQVLNISGNALDCSGVPVASGTAFIFATYNIYQVPVTNGSFNLMLPVCSTPSVVNMVIQDNNSLQQTSLVSVPVSGNNVNAGNVNACVLSVNQFVNYFVDGVNSNVADPTGSGTSQIYGGSYTPNDNYISALDHPAPGQDHISFNFAGSSTGIIPVTTDSIFINQYMGIVLAGASVTITTYPQLGEYYEGNFDIPFEASGSNHTLTGTFRVKRNQ